MTIQISDCLEVARLENVKESLYILLNTKTPQPVARYIKKAANAIIEQQMKILGLKDENVFMRLQAETIRLGVLIPPAEQGLTKKK